MSRRESREARRSTLSFFILIASLLVLFCAFSSRKSWRGAAPGDGRSGSCCCAEKNSEISRAGAREAESLTRFSLAALAYTPHTHPHVFPRTSLAVLLYPSVGFTPGRRYIYFSFFGRVPHSLSLSLSLSREICRYECARRASKLFALFPRTWILNFQESFPRTWHAIFSSRREKGAKGVVMIKWLGKRRFNVVLISNTWYFLDN